MKALDVVDAPPGWGVTRIENMSEPWKVIVCSSDSCQASAFDVGGNVLEGYHVYPDVDVEYMTQFTCPGCGKVETWGPTRCRVAKLLYERLNCGRS